MKVGIAYAQLKRQAWLTCEVPDGTTIREAIERSGVQKQFPEIDLATQKIGVFGKVATLDTVLADGDRVEIYRPLIADPKTAKARAKGKDAAAADAGPAA